MNKEQFKNELKKLNLALTLEKEEQLDKYYNLLITWNKKFNLTAIVEEEQVYLKHFYDSLTITKVINLNDINTILDVGSGAGFPGLVLKIFFPHLKLTIIDSNNKKITFLNEVIKELNLENVTLVHNRCELFARENIETFDVVTARAVANLNILLELCLPIVKINGYFISMKANVSDEIKEIDNELKILNSRIKEIVTFKLPIENSIRNLIKVEKYSSCPIKYPRNYEKIKKKPLK